MTVVLIIWSVVTVVLIIMICYDYCFDNNDLLWLLFWILLFFRAILWYSVWHWHCWRWVWLTTVCMLHVSFFTCQTQTTCKQAKKGVKYLHGWEFVCRKKQAAVSKLSSVYNTTPLHTRRPLVTEIHACIHRYKHMGGGGGVTYTYTGCIPTFIC